ncbi:MAG TPA: hypothetical protein PKD00_07035 [Burkholderiales bacterium]|nr:hypothetical protein [Burkholderiales bacterium]
MKKEKLFYFFVSAVCTINHWFKTEVGYYTVGLTYAEYPTLMELEKDIRIGYNLKNAAITILSINELTEENFKKLLNK